MDNPCNLFERSYKEGCGVQMNALNIKQKQYIKKCMLLLRHLNLTHILISQIV